MMKFYNLGNNIWGIYVIGDTEKRFIFFWNNRNARRKMSGSVLWWFKEFLDEVGHDKAALIMHTDPKDPHGTRPRIYCGFL